MLHLLRPSFVAGVGILDSLSEGALLADRNGKILYINRALLQAMARDPEGQSVMDAMRRLAMRMGAILRRPGEVVEVVGAGKMVQTVTTSCGSYRIRGSLLGGDMLGSGAAVLVNMEALSVPANRSAAERIEQYRLTSAQARVALLIAEGTSDKAIARDLEISPNTVRHHAEQVRLKMGVGTRTEVTHRLLSN